MDSYLVGKEGCSATGGKTKGGAKVEAAISKGVDGLDEDSLRRQMGQCTLQLSFDFRGRVGALTSATIR